MENGEGGNPWIFPSVLGERQRVHIGVEMKYGECICPLRWRIHCNFASDGKKSEKWWVCCALLTLTS
jgi:hypothetical protein